MTQRRHRSLRLCLRTGFSPINAIVLTGKTWCPALGAGTCGGTRVSCRRSAGNHCLPGGLEFRELGKASDMKKAVLVLATAATIGITALVTPSPAQAGGAVGVVGVPVPRAE